ncbi:MAG TPA: hypothetical protein DCP92_15345 [Nitrospiraceae bacterium]|jgi:hypothetical protein|nr:hypothetical protein [Nitrospiraceae bacterium]
MHYVYVHKDKVWTVSLIFLLVFLHACASTKALPGFSAGEQKNSLPFMEKKLLEEVHSVAIPPFYGDDAGWRHITGEVIASSPRLSVIPPEKTDGKAGDAFSVMPEERLDFLGNLGKSVEADAVLNGVILNKEKSHELILQLISSEDSRILWWQAVDIHFPAGSLSPSDQKAVLSQMLDPLIAHVGKREKPVRPVAPEAVKEEPSNSGSLQQKDLVPKGDGQQQPLTKPKTDKKPKKTPQPKPTEEDINPM